MSTSKMDGAEKEGKMKTVNETQTEVTQDATSLNIIEQKNSLAWNDIHIYDEMADQTSTHINLLEQIQKQMNQLEEMSARRQFLTKELMTYFCK